MSIKKYSNHIVTRALLSFTVAIAVIGVMWCYVQSTGGFVGADQPHIVWLTSSNTEAIDQLHLNADSSNNVTASPTEPVLLVECPQAACDSPALDLKDVTEELQGKVIVLAIDPYADSQLASGFESIFITTQLLQSEETQLAENAIAATGQQPTPDLVSSLLSNPQVKQSIEQEAENAVIMKPAYPKFYFFTAKDFNLVFADTGISTKSDLLAVVNQVLTTQAAATDDSAVVTAPVASQSGSAPAVAAPPANQPVTANGAAPVAGATGAASLAASSGTAPAAGPAPAAASAAAPAPAPAAPATAPAPALASAPVTAVSLSPLTAPAGSSVSPASSTAAPVPPAAKQSGSKQPEPKGVAP